MIVLDTHVVFWLAEMPEELSRRARTAIAEERRNGSLAIADITLWELAMMLERGRAVTTVSTADFLREVELQFSVIRVSAPIAARAVSLPRRFPRDPQDRLIAATAATLGVPLVTRDRPIRDSGQVTCIW